MMDERIKKIRLVILDVDGVLTDGRIIYNNLGYDYKFYDVRDGFGVTLLHRSGIDLAIISAKASRTIKRRARDMHIKKLYLNASDKLAAFEKVLKDFTVQPEEICYIGDDLVDLPIIKRVGFAVAVKEAVEDIKKSSHYITQNSGGRGAVREVAELILKGQGKWEQVLSRYSR
jgi:3-deoxy-D-manno-octulosonate 8-phosphate phosphatase (KDO 8-P phosphatase)